MQVKCVKICVKGICICYIFQSHGQRPKRSLMSFFLVVIILSLPIVYYLIKTPSIPSIPNATPHLPILGNALAFIKDPVQYLIDQRALHGDVFLLNLGFVKFVYFLGPEGSNAIFRGTERSGLSQFDTLTLLLGAGAKKCIILFPL